MAGTAPVRADGATFIWSFLVVCVLSRVVVAWTSLGSSVSASSVPNDCRICAVFFTISANPSIAWRKPKYEPSPSLSHKTLERGPCFRTRADRVACACAYGAVGDPLVVAVLLRPPQLLCQLRAIDVGVELRGGAQHDHLK